MSWWRNARYAGVGGVAAVALLAAGCGFRLAGASAHLPAAMRTTYIDSGEPYGHLENLLRRAILADGRGITEERTQATAVLDIQNTQQKRRVVAVDSQGHPKEFELVYRVQFSLLDGHGKALLAQRTLTLRRDLAYSTSIELGAGRRQQQMEADMQREASRLIMLQLEALARHPAQKPPAPATIKTNV